jgi:HD-GYP domain-containing protein (c-di-GMP phosphodiesterase class II)
VNAAAFVTSLVDELVVALVNAQLYGAANARVHDSALATANRIGEFCRDRAMECVLIGIVGDQVIFEGRPVLGASLSAKRLIKRIRDRGSGGLQLLAQASFSDVIALMDALTRRLDRTVGASGRAGHVEANAELEKRGVTAVRFLPPYSGQGAEESPVANPNGELAQIVALHQGTVDLLQGTTIAVCQGKDIEFGDVRGSVEAIVGRLAKNSSAVLTTARYEEYDAYTFGHSIRVCLLALNAARTMVDDPELLNRIGTAALLHDVGKALVPFEVLHKRGRLSPDERHEMERHPVLGAGVLLANRESDPLAVAAAYGHHRTADGNGYPRTRGEFEQSTITRLVKICDCFEALTAVRPYKPPMSPAKAYRIMLSMGGHFDEKMLRHFVRATGIYPVGTRVRLDTGEVARVLRQTADLDRPAIEVIERDGVPVEAPEEYDLTAPERDGPTSVTSVVAEGSEALV